jgi:hypothetical protein
LQRKHDTKGALVCTKTKIRLTCPLSSRIQADITPDLYQAFATHNTVMAPYSRPLDSGYPHQFRWLTGARKEPMARAKKPPGEIDVFRAALGAAHGRTARSSLYRWLRAHHDQFLEDWTEAADWPAFVQAFTALGLTDRTGKPPVPETARKTWLQVRKDVAKVKTKQAERAPILAPGEIAPGVRAHPPVAGADYGRRTAAADPARQYSTGAAPPRDPSGFTLAFSISRSVALESTVDEISHRRRRCRCSDPPRARRIRRQQSSDP